jgi:hypothetical protein
MRFRLRTLLIPFLTMPLMPLCGIVLNSPPVIVFSLGAAAFIGGVILLVGLLAAHSIPVAESSPGRQRFRFTIRDLACLTTVFFGFTIFIVSAFRCEAAERESRPGLLPSAEYRQFAWELEAGLVSMTIGSLIWIRSTRKSTKR